MQILDLILVVQSAVSLTKLLYNDWLSILVRTKLSALIFFAEKIYMELLHSEIFPAVFAKNGSVFRYNSLKFYHHIK